MAECRRALFLDRDGVINVDFGYVHRVEGVKFIDGIFDLVSMAKQLNYFVVVVTNQAGIGRGYYSEQDFHSLMRWMRTKFVEQGGRIDRVYYCPFHPEFGRGYYKRDSVFRKPKPGMLIKARDELRLSLEHSVIVGDKESDMAAGLAAGVGTRLILGTTHQKSMGMHSIGALKEAQAYLRRIGDG